MHLSSSPYVLHASRISFLLIWSPKYLVSTDHKMSHYVIFPTPPITTSITGQIIFLSTLFPNTLSLCSLLTVGDHISHPYRTKGKIIIFYILTIIILDFKLEDKKILHRIMASIPWLQSALNFLHDKNFDLLGMFPNILSVPQFQRIYYLFICRCDFTLHAGLNTWLFT